MYLVNGNKKNWYPGIFPGHDILPSKWHHVLTDASFHTVSRTLRCWELQHITFLTLPFSQIKANLGNFNLSIEMPSKFIKS